MSRRRWCASLPTNPAYQRFGGAGSVSPPRIYYVTPNHGPSTGGTAITISGIHFTGTLAVVVSDADPGGSFSSNVTSLVEVDDNTLTCVVPASGGMPTTTIWVRTAAGVGQFSGYTYDATTNDLLTELSDPLLTEAGDDLITET